MRLFIAAELPENMTEALAETQAALRDVVRGRYVGPDSFHVTLAFLGEVEGSREPLVERALDEACTGFAAVEASLGEFGFFGKARKATLWQALRDGGELAELAGSVRRALADAGFAFDAKAFLPHITLMRAADLTAGELPMPGIAVGTIDAITLFKSDLSGARPAYAPLHTAYLPQP